MKAFDYFLELTKIPRGSCNEKGVSSYVCNFAKKNNLKYEIDNLFNVKIFKDNKSNKTVILQAHLDMVCEKLNNIDFDFKNQGIQTIIDGDFILANGTTLGGDDGFGVVEILEILTSCDLGYPNIEAIFTTQEETTMNGAKSINLKNLKGKHLIGLDGTNSNELVVSCAGCHIVQMDRYVQYLNLEQINLKNKYQFSISGLLGGHSGEDINKNRANANVVGFKFLSKINKLHQIYLTNVSGGNKDNAIPREFCATFLSGITKEQLNDLISSFYYELKNNYPNEKNLKFDFKELQTCDKEKAISTTDLNKLLASINLFPNGIMQMNNIGDVISSINLSSVKLDDNKFSIRVMARFNTIEQDTSLLLKLEEYAKTNNFNFTYLVNAPFFENKKDSELVNICQNVYEKFYNETNSKEKLKIKNIHLGLEGGIFANKIPNLQVVVLGADLYNIHSPNEKMRISSLDKLSVIIKNILLKLNN